MRQFFGILTGLAVLALLPLAIAQEHEKDGKKAEAKKEDVSHWQRVSGRFDLDKDGKITWEEWQKVQSGFAGHDKDNDGVITEKDVKAMEAATRKRIEAEVRRRMAGQHRRFDGRGNRGPQRRMQGRGQRGFDRRGPPRRRDDDRRGGFGPGRGRDGDRGHFGPPRRRDDDRRGGFGPGRGRDDDRRHPGPPRRRHDDDDR